MPAMPDVSTTIVDGGPTGIARAAALIRDGQTVAFPTETVYGLGADATNDHAVARIFAAKDRPRFNPLIVHLLDWSEAERYAVVDERAALLGHSYGPAPLTLVLPRHAQSRLSQLVSAGSDTVALRVPGHSTARALLTAADRPLAAPSANRSGTVSPTEARHVMDSLRGRIPLIVADGRCPVGIESTVLDLSGEMPVILRPGAVTRDELELLIGPVQANPMPIPGAIPGATMKSDSAAETAPARSPGQLASHYAPRAPVRIDVQQPAEGEALLTFGPDLRRGAHVLNLSESGDLTEAAANFFAMLRALDAPEVTAIAVSPIPETGLGVAINDRLRRAAAPRP